MMTQDTDDAQTWRDLSDLLPTHVVERYERTEKLAATDLAHAFPDEDPGEALRTMQLHMLAEAREQVPFAHIPLPLGATGAETWQDNGAGEWDRVVFGTRRTVDHLAVGLDGVQSPDGSVRWSMYVLADDDPATPEQARKFATMLGEAATELERLR